MDKASGLKQEHHLIWPAFLNAAQARISAHVFETWFRPIGCIGLVEKKLQLEVRDQFAMDWLCDHYQSFMLDTLEALEGGPYSIAWHINPNLELPTDTRAEAVEVALEQRPSVGKIFGRPLNPRYVFESFIPGPSNHLALAASRAVAENPGASYNPLFIFGETGLGKTHLLSAVGHQIQRERPSANIVYTSSEQFMNEVVNAVRFSKLEEFHAKYRNHCDVLLMDDIQLIAGKDRTQHEFFHIFNILYDSMKQIVVTSDKLPHEIPDIEERLRTRFQWGLIADIQRPEMETRIAIISQKAENEKIELADDVLLFLAQNVRSNVRELEGALVRVLAHASLTRETITVPYCKRVLVDMLVNRAQSSSVESIQKLVASYYSLKVSDLKSSRRLKQLVKPRQVAMYLCRKHAKGSYPELGQKFGNKDHTTVMSACKKIERLLPDDLGLSAQVEELEKQIAR